MDRKRGPKKGGQVTPRDKRKEDIKRRLDNASGLPVEKFLVGTREMSSFIKQMQGGVGPSASDISEFLSKYNLGSVKQGRRNMDVADVGSGTNVGVRVPIWFDPSGGQCHYAETTPREAMGDNVTPVVIADEFWADWQTKCVHKKAKSDARLKKQQPKATQKAQEKHKTMSDIGGTINTRGKPNGMAETL